MAAVVYVVISFTGISFFGNPTDPAKFDFAESAGRLLVTALLVGGAWMGLKRSQQYPSIKYIGLQIAHATWAAVVALSSMGMFDRTEHWAALVLVMIGMGYLTVQVGEAPEKRERNR